MPVAIRTELEKRGLIIEEKNHVGKPVGENVGIHTIVSDQGNRFAIVSISTFPNKPTIVTFAPIRKDDTISMTERAKLVLD